MRSSRVAFASRSNRSPWHAAGAQKHSRSLPAKLVERAQQVMLVAQPASMFRDDGRTIAVDANPERIAPLAAAPDVDRAVVPASRVLVENPAHLNLRFPLRERRRPEGRGAEPACHASGRLDDRRGNGAAVDMRATAPNWPTFSDERDKGRVSRVRQNSLRRPTLDRGIDGASGAVGQRESGRSCRPSLRHWLANGAFVPTSM